LFNRRHWFCDSRAALNDTVVIDIPTHLVKDDAESIRRFCLFYALSLRQQSLNKVFLKDGVLHSCMISNQLQDSYKWVCLSGEEHMRGEARFLATQFNAWMSENAAYVSSLLSAARACSEECAHPEFLTFVSQLTAVNDALQPLPSTSLLCDLRRKMKTVPVVSKHKRGLLFFFIFFFYHHTLSCSRYKYQKLAFDVPAHRTLPIFFIFYFLRKGQDSKDKKTKNCTHTTARSTAHTPRFL